MFSVKRQGLLEMGYIQARTQEFFFVGGPETFETADIKKHFFI